jgi:hypothetical protein
VAERLFSRDEAQAMLDRVRPLLERARQLSDELSRGASARSLQALSGGNGGGGTARQVVATGQQLREVVGRVQRLGIILRDPATGLIDFPAEHGGEDIFLCWRLDDEGIDWWHPRDQGFAGRRRIDW